MEGSTPNERVVVAMSGGVDSSVAAAILVESGYRVEGATLRLWDHAPRDEERICCSLEGLETARAVCRILGVSHHLVDGRDLFETEVLRPALHEYQKGRTPNPCVLCNASLKLGLLARWSAELSAARVATGHHARIRRDPEGGGFHILRGLDPAKDQSYFLFALSNEALASALMPMGEMTKEDVRRKAQRLGFPNATRKESQDACFLPEDEESFAAALLSRLGGKPLPGEILLSSGEVLGRHDGIHGFTVGQRKGLGVSASERLYVKSIDAATGRIIVGTDDELRSSGLIAEGVVWSSGFSFEGTFRAKVQLRYRHTPVDAEIGPIPGESKDRVEVRFESPQRAVTPGQAAVFYREDRLLGGGWIQGSLSL